MQRGNLRKTKIIATLGPATDSAEMIGKLMDAGVNIFRLNMSHAPHDWVRRVVPDIRTQSAARKKFVGIMMDTQGPAIRTGDIAVPLDLQPCHRSVQNQPGRVDSKPATLKRGIHIISVFSVKGFSLRVKTSRTG